MSRVGKNRMGLEEEDKPSSCKSVLGRVVTEDESPRTEPSQAARGEQEERWHKAPSLFMCNPVLPAHL